MSASLDPDPARVAELSTLYNTRLQAELRAASLLLPGSDRVPHGGDPLARVMLVKGLAGPAEETGAAVLSGPDGEAAASALAALGFARDYFAILSRPVATHDDAAIHGRVRAIVEAADPEYLVCLDETAAIDVAGAFGVPVPVYGRAERIIGRTVVAVEGLEASLDAPALKKRVWSQFKALTPRSPLW